MNADFPFQTILSRALEEGGDLADLFLEQTRSVGIVCEEDRVEKVVPGLDAGAGLRLLIDGRTLYSFTHEISEGSLLDLAERIRSAAKALRRGEGSGSLRPPPPRRPPVSTAGFADWIERHPKKLSMEDRVAAVKRANDLARKLDPRVQQVKILYRDVCQWLSVVSSDGILARGERVETVFSVQVVSAEGDLLQTGYEAVGGTVGFELFDRQPPEEVAEKAAERSLQMLRARKAPMGRMPVVLSSKAGGTMIHEAIGHGLEADLAQRGLSVYSERMGEKVASPLISVVDDPTLPAQRGSYAFDDEGTPSRRTLLVERGVLRGYLYDRLTAMRDGVPSTGNGRRESYREKPIPRMSNTLIVPGETRPEEIVRSVEKGLFVKKMGGGQVNTVNGDFVFEVSEGYLIEKGAVGEPVRGAILTGNGPQVLKEIDRVGDDLGFGIGTCGKEGQGVPVADAQPTLRIPELLVGGQQA